MFTNDSRNILSLIKSDKDAGFQWISRWQHVLYTLAYVSDFSGFLFIFSESRANNLPYVLQFLVLAIVLGYPLVLFQTTAGQYTRNGYLILGDMLPIFYGLGYSMIVVALADLFTQYFYFRGLFHYLVSCVFNKRLPWMECYSAYFVKYPGCFSITDLDKCLFRKDRSKPCFAVGTKTLSAEIYRDGIVFRDADDVNFWFISKKVILRSYVLMGIIVTVLVTSALNKNYKTLYPALRIGYFFSFLFIISCSFLMMTQQGFALGLRNLIAQMFDTQIFLLESWKVMVRKVVLSLKVASGGYFTFGAFIPKAQPDKYRTGVLISAFVSTFFGFLMCFHITSGPLLSLLGLQVGEIMRENEVDYIFILFPTCFGLVPSSNFFSFVFFFVFIIISYFGIVVKVMVLETTISLYFHVFNYASYIRFTICILTTSVVFLFEFSEIGTDFFQVRIIKEVLSMSVVVLQIIALFSYGIGNFGDDIEYMTTFKIKAIVKVGWGAVLLVCIGSLASEVKLIAFQSNLAFNSVCITLIFAPIAVGFLYQLCSFMRKKNLIGLLKASEVYGPPELDDRIKRILYNPRYIVKWKKQEQICTHECLLGCHALQTAVENEIVIVQNIVDSYATQNDEEYEYAAQLKVFQEHLDAILKKTHLLNQQS